MSSLRAFIAESNRIEGIERDPTPEEVNAHEIFLRLRHIGVTNLTSFVRRIAKAELRDKPGMDVRVGQHIPERGGPCVRADLLNLLDELLDLTPYEAHLRYEALHPFMDGNGRSGRVLWAWHMAQSGFDPFALPFLHRFYYQTLDASGR